MQSKKTTLTQHIYAEHLKEINNVKLTHREIDIISFFICGRSAKKIASFFSISPKTVENHTHNIMLKFGCNSRESIIDFIERSDKLLLLRNYYTTILAQAAFDKCLKDISKIGQKENASCVIAYWAEHHFQNFLIHYLEDSLKQAAINVSIQVRNTSHSLQEICKGNHVIYLTPKDSVAHTIEEDELSLCSQNKKHVFFLLSETKEPVKIFKEFDEISLLDFLSQKDFYFLVFEVLKELLPRLNFEKITLQFKQQYEAIEGPVELKQHEHTFIEKKSDETKHSLGRKIRVTLQNQKWPLISAFFVMGVVMTGFLKFKEIERGEKGQYKGQAYHEMTPIRSDLVLPTESVLLNRSELMAEINNKFKKTKGIQTLAFMGIGGAGKTTLAQFYASSQKSPVLWMINAETKETLSASFEALAQALAQTEADQKMLRGILKIKILTEREEKLIQFVKERLKAYSSWFLIYDNVEKFTDIQKYFPKDPSKWGEGRIILTTRDSNIQNNSHINGIISIGELNPEQKLTLFIKIMDNGKTSPFTPLQQEEAKTFLLEIPPFPLDVSVAAYYLKATHISYKSYLENMFKYNRDFSNVQEEILQEAGDYTKTRYGIITLSVKHLIDTNNDFKDLLLFISLLDSQNIPRDLLTRCKNDLIVDNLIYHLQKHSLITSEVSHLFHLDSAFSIHRSTQAIILAYLTKALNPKEDKSLTQPIVKALEESITDAVGKEDFAKMKILYRHAEQLLSHDDLLNEREKALVGGELGCICYYLRHSLKAKGLLEEALSRLNMNPTENPNKVAYFVIYLGNVYRSLGCYEKAKELFEQGLVIYKKYSGNPVGIARASGYLGVVYKSLGDFNKAKSFLEKSLIIYKKFPENRIGLAWSLAHLGGVHRSLEEYEKAKELFVQSFAIYKKYSENHVGAAWVAGDLGDVYIRLGDYKKAKELLEESLAICNKHFSEDHVYVAQALAHLGIFYRETGDYEKAKSLLSKSLAIFEKTYGKDRLETGFVLKNLGKTYFLEGNLESAENTVLRAFDIFHKNKHPDKYMALEGLAEIYLAKSKDAQRKGQFQQGNVFKQQAVSSLTQALEGVKAHFPENSPHVTRIQTRLNTK